MKYIPIILLVLLTVSACKKNSEGPNQAEKDENMIKEYLEQNNIEAIKHESGIYYVIDDPGSGGHPDLSSNVEVRYKGYLLNGTVFDQTTGDNTVDFPLNNLIKGWQIGIPLLQKGGSGTFFIPSELGYGSSQVGPIAPNSVLIFEIELVDFS